MKTSFSLHSAVLVLLGSAGFLNGAPPADSQATSAAASSPPYVVVGRDANSRVWEQAGNGLDASGLVKHRYVELATGMHYWENGQWAESKAEIELYGGGAIARQGQHKVIFANNLATVGAIDLETPDGQRLRSHILGVELF